MTAISFFVKFLVEDRSTNYSEFNSDMNPDYFVEKMERFSFDKKGKLQNELESELVKHFPHDDSLELKSPRMKIYEKKGKPWNVVSESAWINSDGTIVLLNGNVYIWKLDNYGNKEYGIITSDLTIKPEEKFAQTKKAARITNQGTVTNTIGLKVVFKEGRVQLSDRVRTIYEPK